MPGRMGLPDRGLETGKLARMHRILDRHGLANGTALFLPYDQGLEHGPRDFFATQQHRIRPTSSGSRSRAASTASCYRSAWQRSSCKLPLLGKDGVSARQSDVLIPGWQERIETSEVEFEPVVWPSSDTAMCTTT